MSDSIYAISPDNNDSGAAMFKWSRNSETKPKKKKKKGGKKKKKYNKFLTSIFESHKKNKKKSKIKKYKPKKSEKQLKIELKYRLIEIAAEKSADTVSYGAKRYFDHKWPV